MTHQPPLIDRGRLAELTDRELRRFADGHPVSADPAGLVVADLPAQEGSAAFEPGPDGAGHRLDARWPG